MSETYLKPSQTSKMKVLAKVVNASKDVFRTVFNIQNVFRTSNMELFKPQKASSLIFCWVMKTPLEKYFCKIPPKTAS